MRSRWRRFGGRVFQGIVWIAAAYYFLLGGEYTAEDIRELRAEREGAAARVDSLRAVADSIERRSDRLERDSFAIERTARERYGFVRDGERLFRFLDAPPPGSR